MGQGWTNSELATLTSAVQHLLVGAMDRRPEYCAGILADVGLRFGHTGVYSLCKAMAEAVKRLSFGATPDGDSSTFGVSTNATPEQERRNPDLWAARFMAAYLNDDTDQQLALFFAPLNAGDADAACANVSALVAMAADLARNAERRNEENR